MEISNSLVLDNVPIVGRVSPTIGVYDVIKYVNPRLLHIQFLADASYGRELMIYGKDNENQEFMTSRFPRYLEAHDRSGELIYDRVEVDEVDYTTTISLVWKANGRHRYYLTSIRESRSYNGCHCGYQDCRYADCGEMMNFLDYNYEYIGQTLEEAIFKYMEHVSEYGV